MIHAAHCNYSLSRRLQFFFFFFLRNVWHSNLSSVFHIFRRGEEKGISPTEAWSSLVVAINKIDPRMRAGCALGRLYALTTLLSNRRKYNRMSQIKKDTYRKGILRRYSTKVEVNDFLLLSRCLDRQRVWRQRRRKTKTNFDVKFVNESRFDCW